MTTKPFAVLLAFLSLAAAGCHTPNRRATSAEVLLEADAAFARAAAARGVAQAFRDYAAPDAMVLPAGAEPVTGREAIFQIMQQDPGELTWTPAGADLCKGGDLGYTWGRFQFRETAPNRPAAVHYGKYLTVWKRQPDGSWKFVADIGNSSPAPK